VKFLRFLDRVGRNHTGILKDGETVIIAKGTPFYGLSETEDRMRLSEVASFLPPVYPPNVFALGLNYGLHAAETGKQPPDHPMIFLKGTNSVTAHLQPIRLPAPAPCEVDYECELAVIIGRTARKVTPGQARDYILAYTCGNDVSARDCQTRLDLQWARAKSFDTFCPLGPVADTDFNPSSARITTTLNGKIMQDSNVSDLIFNVFELVSFISQGITLWPGTVIMTGTPNGVGFTRKPPVFLRPGDTVEVEIGGLGRLINPVVADNV